MKSNFFENTVIKRATMAKIVGGNDITDPDPDYDEEVHGSGLIAVPRNVVGIGVAVGITDPEIDG